MPKPVIPIYPFRTLKIAFALLAAAVLLSGCPAPDSRNPAKQENPNVLQFDVAMPFGPFSLDPFLLKSSLAVCPFVFSFLAVEDHSGNLQPDLAEKWEYDETRFEWTFYLRKNARFHDGKPVTARDAVFSLKMDLVSYLPDIYAGIRSMDAVSDTEVRICLFQNDPEFLSKIWDVIRILPAPRNPDLLPEEYRIGSGPFRLKEISAHRIILEANAAYYRGRPSIDGMIFNYVPDPETIWTRLMGGQTDAAQGVTPENASITEACADHFYLSRLSLPYYTMLLFNTHDPVFSDVRVRKALTMAIHREDAVQKILNGNGAVASGPMGPQREYHNPETATPPYDPQKALELLAQAGWRSDDKSQALVKNGKLFEFTVYVSEDSTTHQKLARYLRLCFNDIGIRLYVRQMPAHGLFKCYVGNTDFQAVITQAQYPTRSFENIKNLWSRSDDIPSVCGRFEDEVVEALFEALDEQTDPEMQRDLLYAIEARIIEVQPAAFLYHETIYYVMSRRFHLPGPFYMYPDQGWNLQFASLKKSGFGN
ncbi:MAG: ABC transporter substrate-binding protein [Desulfobacterales bacterium]|jgi:peptide/nickel transport system substrate-binding protein|nr:ABC transporter substrate-binding protein [Desulfobacterales bacterium]